MKREFSTRKLMILVAAILVLIPLAAGAQHFGRGPERLFGHGFLMGRMAERLELTDGQRDEVHGILEANRDQFEPLLIEQARLHKELADAIHAEVFDEGVVREVAGKLGEAGVEMAVLRGRVAQEVMIVLTPEQRAEARELREEFGEGRERWHGRHGRGPGGPPASDGK